MVCGAREALAALDYGNVEVGHGDRTAGAPNRAPLDAVSVTAIAQDELPPTPVEQLPPDGVCSSARLSARGRVGELVRLQHGRIRSLLPGAPAGRRPLQTVRFGVTAVSRPRSASGTSHPSSGAPDGLAS